MGIGQRVISVADGAHPSEDGGDLLEVEQPEADGFEDRPAGAAERERAAAGGKLRLDGGVDRVHAVLGDQTALADVVVVRVGDGGDVV